MADSNGIPVLSGLFQIVKAPFKLVKSVGETGLSIVTLDGDGVANGFKGIGNSIFDVPEGAFSAVGDVASAGTSLFSSAHFEEKNNSAQATKVPPKRPPRRPPHPPIGEAPLTPPAPPVRPPHPPIAGNVPPVPPVENKTPEAAPVQPPVQKAPAQPPIVVIPAPVQPETPVQPPVQEAPAPAQPPVQDETPAPAQPETPAQPPVQDETPAQPPVAGSEETSPKADESQNDNTPVAPVPQPPKAKDDSNKVLKYIAIGAGIILGAIILKKAGSGLLKLFSKKKDPMIDHTALYEALKNQPKPTLKAHPSVPGNVGKVAPDAVKPEDLLKAGGSGAQKAADSTAAKVIKPSEQKLLPSPEQAEQYAKEAAAKKAADSTAAKGIKPSEQKLLPSPEQAEQYAKEATVRKATEEAAAKKAAEEAAAKKAAEEAAAKKAAEEAAAKEAAAKEAAAKEAAAKEAAAKEAAAKEAAAKEAAAKEAAAKEAAAKEAAAKEAAAKEAAAKEAAAKEAATKNAASEETIKKVSAKETVKEAKAAIRTEIKDLKISIKEMTHEKTLLEKKTVLTVEESARVNELKKNIKNAKARLARREKGLAKLMGKKTTISETIKVKKDVIRQKQTDISASSVSSEQMAAAKEQENVISVEELLKKSGAYEYPVDIEDVRYIYNI